MSLKTICASFDYNNINMRIIILNWYYAGSLSVVIDFEGKCVVKKIQEISFSVGI